MGEAIAVCNDFAEDLKKSFLTFRKACILYFQLLPDETLQASCRNYLTT